MIPRSAMTWALAFLLAVFMIALTTIAQAGNMVTQNAAGDRVTLFDTPCKNGKILAAVEKAFVKAGQKAPNDLQAGEVRFVKEGTFAICWRVNISLQVGIVYESGDAAAIPLLMFGPEKGI